MTTNQDNHGDEKRPSKKTPFDFAGFKPQKAKEGAPERKTFKPREGGSDRPERKSEGRSYGDKPERKAFGSGDRKPYESRTPREGGSYNNRDGARPARPYGASSGGDRKPYAPREGGGDKPFRKSYDKPLSPRGEGRSFAPREGSRDGGREGGRSFTPREGGRESRPFTPREGGRESRPFTPREGGRSFDGGFKKDGFVKPGIKKTWEERPKREFNNQRDNRDAAWKGSRNFGERRPLSALAKAFIGLKSEKGRLENSRFILEGIKNITDIINVSPDILHEILYSSECNEKELMTLAKAKGVALTECSVEDIQALCDTETHQGALAIANFATLRPDWNTIRYVTLLDGVQDPGNVGAIFRTSLALGMDAVVLGKGTCEAYNSKVVRSSVGSLMRLPFESGVDLGNKISFLKQKGFTVVATSPHAKETLDTAKLRKKVALLVGSEGAGANERFMAMADSVVYIPMKQKVESLNVAVAHGILSYALVNKRD